MGILEVGAGAPDLEVGRGEAAREEQRGGARPARPHAGAGRARRRRAPAERPRRVPRALQVRVHGRATVRIAWISVLDDGSRMTGS